MEKNISELDNWEIKDLIVLSKGLSAGMSMWNKYMGKREKEMYEIIIDSRIQRIIETKEEKPKYFHKITRVLKKKIEIEFIFIKMYNKSIIIKEYQTVTDLCEYQ